MIKRFLTALIALSLILSCMSALALSDTALEDYPDVMDMTGYFSTGPAFGDENLQHKWLQENLKINIIGSFSTGDSPANKLAQMVASGEMPAQIATPAASSALYTLNMPASFSETDWRNRLCHVIKNELPRSAISISLA